MDYAKIALSIKAAIDRRPADKGAYDDLFSLCRGWEAEDFAYEFDLSLINHSLNNKIDTIFIPCEQKYVLIKSSTIKELAKFGGDISQMVPDLVAEKLREKLKN